MNARTISPVLHHIAHAWPRDPLRPTIQFASVLEFLATSNSVQPRTVAAARALSENRLKTQFPLTDKMTSPPSSPVHYTRLLEGVEKSLRGEKRSWIERFFAL